MRTGLVACLVLLGTGCLIDRGPLTGEPSTRDAGRELDAAGLDAASVDAPGLDAARPDAPGLDTGPACVPLDCDDGNACTDDVCTAAGCTHTAHTRACDDGVRCNGADQCAAGTCSVHDGVDPCAAPTHCDATSDTCVGCTGDSDCPGREEGPLGMCMPSGADVCALTGSASRSVTTYTCVASSCTPTTSSETMPCRRDTDGFTCAPEMLTEYGACAYADATCSESGTRSRTHTTHACSAGTCGSVSEIELDMAGCSRTTGGAPCGTEVRDDWSPCGGFSDACDESGTRSRQVHVPLCTGGACATETRTETEACTRTTAGLTCGPETCGALGACMRNAPTTCAPEGSQSRTCSTPVCGAGTCSGMVMRTETLPCTVSTMGLSCTPPMGCTPCIEPGRTGCRSGRDGERYCSDGVGATCTLAGCIDASPVTEFCVCP